VSYPDTMTDTNLSSNPLDVEARASLDPKLIDAPPTNDDLGIGRIAAERSSARFVNSDGTFNTRRLGLGFLSSQNTFYRLITLPPAMFFGLLAFTFIVVNLFFGALYWLCGPNALQFGKGGALENSFWRGFFFSVQTLSTIGYGHVAPLSLAANIVATIEAFVGLLGVALATGLLFARFSKPMSRILFSKNMLFAPYQDGTGWMIRVVNGLQNEIIDIEASVTLSWYETINGARVRRFPQLKLERQKVGFFNLSWTLVHPIVEGSPLWGISERQLLDSDAEFLVVLQGVDDILFQRVHARSSYKAKQAIWNAKFADMYAPPELGFVAVDATKLSDYKKLG
jgi:inward rectifier potassium channel